jgi:hypothetical protein
MHEESCEDQPLSPNIAVIPLPIALYVSEGLIFELYNGGQPRREFLIRWERLPPTVDCEGTK